MTANPTTETRQKPPESMSAAFPIFPLIILHIVVMVGSIFLLLIIMSVTNLPPAPADQIPFFPFTILLTYIVTRLVVAKDWGWRTAFALNWLRPRLERPAHQLNDTISISAYCVIMMAVFALLLVTHPYEPLFPEYSEAGNNPLSLYMYRIMFAVAGAIFLPWLALRVYIVARFGSDAVRKSQWAID